MKVYFIGNGPNHLGCYYVRCLIPAMANGWKGNYNHLTKSGMKEIKMQVAEMLDSDVIVFHRANTNWHHRIGMTLREQGKKIVFDNDDTFKLDSDSAFANLDEKGFYENKEKLNNVTNNFVLNSDLITVSTNFLADEYSKINPNVVVLPNCINPEDYPEKPRKNETDKVRIGLVGSVAYHQDFQIIKELIRKLDKDKRVQLVLFGLWKDKHRSQNPLVEAVHYKEYAFWDSLQNLEHIGWCEMADYIDNLEQAKLDMMLIPRQDNYFNRCKSNIKYLEASMLEIPVIAQSMTDGPYQELNGSNGLLATDDWEEKVELLIQDKELRTAIGKNAKDYVLSKYDINKNKSLWTEAYKKIWQEK